MMESPIPNEKGNAGYSNDTSGEAVTDRFEDIINAYLSILDHQQNEIYSVRMMHHEVWRDVHQVTGIAETRAGSRVERYTKILPIGSKSDVDYKLCVQGIEIEKQEDGKLYFVPCQTKAYCKLYVTDEGMAMLEENELLSKLFRYSTFKCPESERSIVKPAVFKTNVVEHCKFEMRETGDQKSPTSPAVSGEGALNPYDIVPCLKLRTWPYFMRKNVLDMYNFKLNKETLAPIFLVPTGDPFSQSRDFEWRLSFAVLEIEIFRQLKSHQRRFYGLAKYIFKVVFEDMELIQSYHLKILFLRKLEDDDLSKARPLPFLFSFFKYVLDAVEKQNIPHLFIEGCNIYPFHYHSDMKKEQFRSKIETENFRNNIRLRIKEIISHDTRTKNPEWNGWLESANRALVARQAAGVSEIWIAGYLTRLLSVIVYCILKCQHQNKLNNAIRNLVKVVQAYHHDKYVDRVIPFVKCLLKDVHHMDLVTDFGTTMVRSCDKVSFALHRAFYCYERNDISQANHYLAEAANTEVSQDTLGITVTKFHTGIDQPLDYVISYCENKLNANRFYLCQNMIRLHMAIQLQIRKLNVHSEIKSGERTNKNLAISQKISTNMKVNMSSTSTVVKEARHIKTGLAELVTELVNAADAASVREPYTGKLSYKHASFLLLMGYREQFSRSENKILREIPVIFSDDYSSYDRKELATNFDLR